MGNTVSSYTEWAGAVGAAPQEVADAWEDLRRRGLVTASNGTVALSPLAMRRATSDLQRRLASHLSGYLLTENSYIVRAAGDPPGSPCVLDTRIAVEYIANYFKQGWGVTGIEEDLGLLTRDEIEAAIQYYLNHREEIEAEVRDSREIYEANVPMRQAA